LVRRHSVVRITRATAPRPECLHTDARNGPTMQVRSFPRGAVRDGGKQDGWEWSERTDRGQRRRSQGRDNLRSAIAGVRGLRAALFLYRLVGQSAERLRDMEKARGSIPRRCTILL